MGVLDDVPLPGSEALLGASAALSLSLGAATLVKPKKMHELYFKSSSDDEDINNHQAGFSSFFFFCEKL